jgi:ABC-type antimicrobial peptide transport system permease subunit
MKAFVRAEDLRRLLNIAPSAGHEIAIVVDKNGMENQVAEKLVANHAELQTLKWTKLVPEMEMMNENINLMMYIFVVIILLALGFGIVNTMLMAIMERVKEIGMLMAVGMNRIRVFAMIVTETVFLSLTGGIIGIVLALATIAVTAKTGIDLSLWAQGLNSAGFDAIIYPEIGFDSVVVVTILVMITGLLSALYPARKAIKLNPAEAIRIDM